MTKTAKPKDLSYGIKPPISLVPPVFIIEVARCMEDGAKKRAAYNWRESKVSAMQLLDKVLRHTLACIERQDITEDSKLSNLASAAADIAVYLDAQKHGVLVDDRPINFKQGALNVRRKTRDVLNHKYPDSFACTSNKCTCK